MEYHAFGIISEGRESPYHYMICGVQGDFTKGLVSKPPKTVWTRELKFGKVHSLTISLLNLNVRFTNQYTSQPASVTPPSCFAAGSASVLARASALRCPRAYSRPTGSLYG